MSTRISPCRWSTLRAGRNGVRIPARREAGVVLLVVLMILLVVAASSTSFIWFMNQQQARAGARFRSVAAFAAAEAGVHRAMAILESIAPDGRAGRLWRPQAFLDTVSHGALEGRYTVSITDAPGNAVLVTSAGEVGGLTRWLRARVHLASPALLVAVYGTSFVRLDGPPTATFILPYGAGIGDRPWAHIASGQGIWIANSEMLLNHSGVAFRAEPGPVDALEGPGSATAPPRPGPLRLMLASGAELRIDNIEQRVTAVQLRTVGIEVEGVQLRAGPLPAIPTADRTYFRAQAVTNTTNAGLNRAAGRYAADHELELKRDSLYTAAQFNELLNYMRSLSQLPSLQGVIYITGGFVLEGQQLRIDGGTLVTEDTVRLDQGGTLEVIHSGATRTLPGMVLLDEAQCIVTGQARLRVHGLVHANKVMDVENGARVEIVGAILGNDPAFSFRNSGGTVVIRYDPAVLGTPGLRTPDDQPVIAWVSAWEELPFGLTSPGSPPPLPVIQPPVMPPPVTPPSATASPPQFEATPLPAVRASLRPAPPSPRPVATPAPAVQATRRPPVTTSSLNMQPERRLPRVQVGAFASRQNATARVALLRQAGFNTYIVKERGLFKVWVGALRNRGSAQELAERLRARGFNVFMSHRGSRARQAPRTWRPQWAGLSRTHIR